MVECYESTNTTPEAGEVWRHRQLPHVSRQSMVMEVSSQALKYQRVENLPFDVACFLNIGRDHISPIEHPTFEDYFESKLRIFDQAKTAVVNLGTEEVDRVLEAASTAERLVTVGVEHPEASLWASDVRMVGFSIEFNLHGLCADESEAGEKVLLGIAGDFNVENRWSLSPLRARSASYRGYRSVLQTA
ncbi:MAG: Mur ligase family protein [Collinsella sp.]